jgi:hypothetical protein
LVGLDHRSKFASNLLWPDIMDRTLWCEGMVVFSCFKLWFGLNQVFVLVAGEFLNELVEESPFYRRSLYFLNHVVTLPAQSSVEGCAGDGLF